MIKKSPVIVTMIGNQLTFMGVVRDSSIDDAANEKFESTDVITEPLPVVKKSNPFIIVKK